MEWSLIFTTDNCSQVQMFTTKNDPQKAAIEIVKEHPFLRLIAAVKGTPKILVMDNARTKECGLQWWPE